MVLADHFLNDISHFDVHIDGATEELIGSFGTDGPQW